MIMTRRRHIRDTNARTVISGGWQRVVVVSRFGDSGEDGFAAGLDPAHWLFRPCRRHRTRGLRRCRIWRERRYTDNDASAQADAAAGVVPVGR